MNSELSALLKRMSEEDRTRICELLKNSPELEKGGMTAFDWLLDHGDGIYGKAAKLFKAIAEAK